MINPNTLLSRRLFLQNSSLLAAAALAPAGLLAQASAPGASAEGQLVIPNRDTLLKFHADGTPRPFAGNTVICHLPVQCAMRDAMVDLHEALTAAPYRSKLGLTSTSSYHMTVFPGANDQDRAAYKWPNYVPLDAPMETCNRMVGDRMAKAHWDYTLPIRVRVDRDATVHYPLACTLRMVPVDAAEEHKLRTLRDQIAQVYGFRLPDHATYAFHMTLSYQIAPFTAQEQTAYRALLRPHVDRIIAAEPVLELGEPEYCSFPDMFRFEPIHLLSCP